MNHHPPVTPTTTPPTGSLDPRRWLWPLGLITPGCALLPSQLVYRTGAEALWWIGPFIVLIAIPVLDWIVGDDGHNPAEHSYPALAADRYYRWCTYLFVPVELVGLVVAAAMWAGSDLSTVDKLGLAVTVGFVSGVGINAAHELGHRTERGERILAKIALAPTGYGHFLVEHNRGHHARVATPDDPASARLGESLWMFLPRSVIGGLRSAIDLERSSLARQHRRWWTAANTILQAWSMTVLLAAGLVVAFGPTILGWLAVQAVTAIAVLETVNYIEHYGLLRDRKPDGGWQRCSARDSWNSDRLVTNILLFQLQRHSDHHAHPGRRYQTLRTTPESPQLPGGYATMILLASIPPLWRAVMDPKVAAHYGGDLTRAHLPPPSTTRGTGQRG